MMSRCVQLNFSGGEKDMRYFVSGDGAQQREVERKVKWPLEYTEHVLSVCAQIRVSFVQIRVRFAQIRVRFAKIRVRFALPFLLQGPVPFTFLSIEFVNLS